MLQAEFLSKRVNENQITQDDIQQQQQQQQQLSIAESSLRCSHSGVGLQTATVVVVCALT